MYPEFFQGFGTGGGLIVAVGAQNAFVLSQAVRRNHHVPIMLVCILFDVVFITAGVGGIGAIMATSPMLRLCAAWGGGAFLAWYGWRSLAGMVRGGAGLAADDAQRTLRSAILFTVAVTLLNPHFYLDTVVLLGSVATRFEGEGRYIFGMGAITASCVWFTLLTFGGAMLAPVFRRPVAWRVLDGVVWVIMWSIATGQFAYAISHTFPVA